MREHSDDSLQWNEIWTHLLLQYELPQTLLKLSLPIRKSQPAVFQSRAVSTEQHFVGSSQFGFEQQFTDE